MWPFNLSPADLITLLLSAVIFLPSIGAVVLCFFPGERQMAIKRFSLLVTIVVFALTVYMAIPAGSGEAPGRFALNTAAMQSVCCHRWIPAFNIYYFLGTDGISFPLVILTSFLSMLAMWASWPITRHVKAYCFLFLLLETGMLGVFLSLDFFLFYVFWEVMLLPMYFLIGIWGGPRREYAAIKFFLFTLVGSVLILVAMLMLYFASDASKLDAKQIADGRAAAAKDTLATAETARNTVTTPDKSKPVHTFDIMALTQMGQHQQHLFTKSSWLGKSLSWWAFVLLFIGFVIKLPAVPVHTWLPDAHVEAPTPISMILAGVLLKMGGYGILRFCYPICPDAAYELSWLVGTIGLVSMIYGALASMAQKDFKRLVAYSSVSHMGYVLLGIAVWSAAAGNRYNTDYWQMGMNGAMFQMIAHGLSSAGMFFMVGVLYDRVHHRNLDQFGGLFARMPVASGLAMGIFFAALGLPGLCGFIGEFFVVLGTWSYSAAMAVVAASAVILTAGYILWTIQRVYLGAEYKGPHGDSLSPITRREILIAVPLLVFAIILGVYPAALLNYSAPSVNKIVDDLTVWQKSQPAKSADARPGKSNNTDNAAEHSKLAETITVP
jgi:NADH-quinone oxidoreductase subunit M